MDSPLSTKFLNLSSVIFRPAAGMESDAPGSHGSRPWHQLEKLKIPKRLLGMIRTWWEKRHGITIHQYQLLVAWVLGPFFFKIWWEWFRMDTWIIKLWTRESPFIHPSIRPSIYRSPQWFPDSRLRVIFGPSHHLHRAEATPCQVAGRYGKDAQCSTKGNSPQAPPSAAGIQRSTKLGGCRWWNLGEMGG